MPPSAYATARLRIITARMGLLDLRVCRFEAAFVTSDGEVSEAFQEDWDRAMDDWWTLAEEAEALSAGLHPDCPALADIASAMARMIQVPLPGPC